MKTAKLLLIFLTILSFHSVSAQYAVLSYTNFYSRYARVLRMGDTYTGIASGIESVFYNPAGLAGYDKYGVVYSRGHGIGVIHVKDVTPYNFAVAAPIPGGLGNIGFSYDRLNLLFKPKDSHTEVVYSLHLARNFSRHIALGLSFDYSTIEEEFPLMYSESTGSLKGDGIGMGISALLHTPVLKQTIMRDELKFGVFLKNVLSTKMDYEKGMQDNIAQVFRAGISYSIIPQMDKYNELNPLKLTVAFDAVSQGIKYNTYAWRANYAIEMSFYEILQLSFGRENESRVKYAYSYSPQFPVNRYGFGLNLPLSKLLYLKNNFSVEINYSRSDWQKVDQLQWADYMGNRYEIDPNAFSVSAAMGL